MEIEVCVAARDRAVLSKYYGPTHVIGTYPPPIAVKTETRGTVRIWIGTGNELPLDYRDVWLQTFPGREIPLSQSLQLAYDLNTANFNGYEYVQLLLRPGAAVLERWLPQEGFEPDSIWAVFTSPIHF